MLSEDDVRERLRAAIREAGSQKAYAEQHKLSEAYISDVLRGRREPARKILEALGLVRVVGYVAAEDRQSPR